MDEFECSQIGIENENIRDRVFMIVTSSGEFITARTHPSFVHIMPSIKGDIMTLSAPGMDNLEIDINRLYIISASKATIWEQQVNVVDAGDDAAQWISKFALKKDSGLRLVFYPQTFPTREVREKNKVFDTMISEDSGALHNTTSFMLINEASIADLNLRVEKQVTALQFRPNIVIRGPTAYAEDSWKWLKIGDKTVFRNVKPCGR